MICPTALYNNLINSINYKKKLKVKWINYEENVKSTIRQMKTLRTNYEFKLNVSPFEFRVLWEKLYLYNLNIFVLRLI